MQALRAAWAAYRDGWGRVMRAPRLLLALAGLVAAITAASPAGLAASHPFQLDLFTPLGPAVAGGALAAALDASDMSGRLGGEAAPWVLWLLIVLAGTVLSGGAMDRYARQRPLDSRAFWGVSGELAFRLIRLGLLGSVLLAVISAALFVVLNAIDLQSFFGGAYAPTGDGPSLVYGPTVLLEVAIGAVYLAAVAPLFAAIDSARVRLVVERRHSAVFAFTAGVRFVRRRLAVVLLLYAGLFVTAAVAWGVFSAAVWLADPTDLVVRLLDALQAGSVVVAALVACAAAVSLFQANLAHATYVAPPPLVWPDSPAVETLGARDIPPAV